MGRTYHNFKPQKLFERELETNEFFDCKRKEWVTVIPPRRYKIAIQLEKRLSRGSVRRTKVLCSESGMERQASSIWRWNSEGVRK